MVWNRNHLACKTSWFNRVEEQTNAVQQSTQILQFHVVEQCAAMHVVKGDKRGIILCFFFSSFLIDHIYLMLLCLARVAQR